MYDLKSLEGSAMGFYGRMAEKYWATEIAIQEIFEDLLKDEVDDEEQREKFLAKL